MTIQTENLLVLKAFYMGHAISEKKHNIAIALDMVEAAIRKFARSENRQDKLRLLFYLLLKAEILRETSKVVEIRALAKEVSQQIGGEIFDFFMAIESSTQPTASHIGDSRVATKTARWNAACRALGIDERRLTKQENHFLKTVTLKKMLEKHEVTFHAAL